MFLCTARSPFPTPCGVFTAPRLSFIMLPRSSLALFLLLVMVATCASVSLPSPVAAWTFDSPSLLAVDGVSGESLTVVGGATWTPAGASGGGLSLNPGDCLRGTGSVPSALPTGNSPYTISVWFQASGPCSSTHGGVCALLGWGAWGNPGQVNAVRIEANGLVPRNYWWNLDLTATTSSSLFNGAWHNIVATYDGAIRSLYIDGVFGGTDQPGAGNAPSSGFNIGLTDPGFSTFIFNGVIDSVLIFDHALTALEVAAVAERVSATSTSAPSSSLSATPAPSCLPSVYNSHAYSDLSGTVLSVFVGAQSERDCQLSCCAAAGCTGYSWAGQLPNLSCFLLANVTGVTPNLVFSSGVLVAASPLPTPLVTPSSPPLVSPPGSPSTAGSVGPRRSPTGTAQGTPSQSPAVSSTVTLPPVINTLAGNGAASYSGDGGLATLAGLNTPYGVTVDSLGNIYVCDSHNSCIRRINHSTGIITTIAGSATQGYSGDGGQATSSELNQPGCIAVDSELNLYIADWHNSRIRVVSKESSVISTIAGNGVAGFNGDGAIAISAELNFPWGVTVDSAFNVFIVDTNNMRVRFVAKSTGIITTIAGNGVAGYGGDGGQATSASLLYPIGIVVDRAGNFYIADTYNNRVRFVSKPTGIISTIAGSGSVPYPQGGGYSGDGGKATSAALNGPTGVALDGLNNLYIADVANNCIRLVNVSTDAISTVVGSGVTAGFSGDGGPASSATLFNPRTIAFDSAMNMYVADPGNNRIRVVTPFLQSLTPTPTPTPYCESALYRFLPRTDLVGTLTGNAWYPGTALPAASESACRQACCDAPVCDAYTFASNDLQFAVQQGLSHSASCFLYTNVTALVPSSGYTSGALLSTYS